MPTPSPLPARPPRVLILGANGRFGAAATAAFAEAGWDVLAQVRRAPTQCQRGVRTLRCELADIDALAAAAAGARAVVYAVNPAYTAWRAQMLPLARHGMDLAQRLDASFMLPGNVYNFGRGMAAVLREDTPQRPDTVKGRLRVELENEVRARRALGLRSVMIRAGDFFGGGSGNWFDQVIVKSLPKGRLVYPGPLHATHAWAYLPDLARAFVTCAARDDLPAFAVLHCPGYAPTGGELLDRLERAARSLGLADSSRPLERRGLPWALLRAASPLVPMWRELAEMAYLWRVPHALDGTLLRRTLGPLAVTPLDEALANALRGSAPTARRAA